MSRECGYGCADEGAGDARDTSEHAPRCAGSRVGDYTCVGKYMRLNSQAYTTVYTVRACKFILIPVIFDVFVVKGFDLIVVVVIERVWHQFILLERFLEELTQRGDVIQHIAFTLGVYCRRV